MCGRSHFLFQAFNSLRLQVRKNLFSRITDNLLIEISDLAICREQRSSEGYANGNLTELPKIDFLPRLNIKWISFRGERIKTNTVKSPAHNDFLMRIAQN